MKKPHDTPYLSFTLSSTETCVVSQDGYHHGCAAPACIGPVWLAETVMI